MRWTMMSEDQTQQSGERSKEQSRMVVGVFDSDAQAAAAEQGLEQAGFSRDDISVVAKSTDERAAEVSVGRQMVRGAAKGALLAGLVAAAVAVPGVGLLVAAGPVAFMLGAGGLVGSFIGLGLARDQAERYENLVRAGAEVVIVGAANERHAELATRILSQHGAHD